MKTLENITVLDFGRVLAGPYCGMLLADFGANVIKIEAPKGDDARIYGPFIGKESAYFMSLNRNKKSIALDLKKPEAKEIIKSLVRKSDVVLENFRPGTMEKLGLGYDVLAKINPRIIYAASSGFGHTGPYSHKAAYDAIIQGMGGLMSITGQPGGEPTRVGASVADVCAGLFTALGIMLALHHRDETGEGQKVDVAMLDCQVAVLENAIARYFIGGAIPGPIGNRHPSVTPFESFKAEDGYVMIAIGNENLWAKLCKIINHEELLVNPLFSTNDLRTQNHAALKPVLDAVFIQGTVEYWVALLDGAGIPCGPVNTIDKVVVDPQVLARDMIVEVDHPTAGRLKVPGVPIKLSKTPGAVEKPAPLLGQHSLEILTEMLGYTNKQVAELKSMKVVF